MFASGGKFGSLAAVAFALMCNLNTYGALVVDTVDDIDTGNSVIDVAPGDTFTIDLIISDDGIPRSPFGDFYSASTTLQITGISQGVSFANAQPGGFETHPDYIFLGDSFGALMTVSSSIGGYANDSIDVADTAQSFTNYDISTDSPKLLARVKMKVNNRATPGDVYDLTPFVLLTDLDKALLGDPNASFFPDSVSGATIRVVAVPEASSFIGWALMGVTMCGVVCWRRSRAPAEVAKPDRVTVTKH